MPKYYLTTQGEHVTWYEKTSSGTWEFRNWNCGRNVQFEYDPERDACICVWDHQLSYEEIDTIKNGVYPFPGVVGLVHYLPNVQMGEVSEVKFSFGDKATLPTALDVQVGGSHYKDMKIQPVEFIVANNIPFVEGCCIKYLCRWRAKNGVEDLKKAIHFIQMLIEMEERGDDRS